MPGDAEVGAIADRRAFRCRSRLSRNAWRNDVCEPDPRAQISLDLYSDECGSGFLRLCVVGVVTNEGSESLGAEVGLI